MAPAIDCWTDFVTNKCRCRSSPSCGVRACRCRPRACGTVLLLLFSAVPLHALTLPLRPPLPFPPAQGTFYLLYYLSGQAAGRKVACVREDGEEMMITPGQVRGGHVILTQT